MCAEASLHIPVREQIEKGAIPRLFHAPRGVQMFRDARVQRTIIEVTTYQQIHLRVALVHATKETVNLIAVLGPSSPFLVGEPGSPVRSDDHQVMIAHLDVPLQDPQTRAMQPRAVALHGQAGDDGGCNMPAGGKVLHQHIGVV